jgi:enoyl-CoA hydratase/carnithine racemase
LKRFEGLLRCADVIHDCKRTGILYEWAEEKAYLAIHGVRHRDIPGAILYYHNPPVHQIGTTALHAFHEGLDRVIRELKHLEYFILYGPNDPVHSGGDLKESLEKLQKSLRAKEEMERSGAAAGEMDKLFSWGETRLEKGILLYQKIRRIAHEARVVGVCGGGLRFGGSAEIQLMADILVGDSRSGMCFSEAMIGIIPGWAGMARVLTKAGIENAEYMTKTAHLILADDLYEMGIYNELVNVPRPLPRRQNGKGPDFHLRLQENDRQTGLLLLPRALKLATCPKTEIPFLPPHHRKIISSKEKILREVKRRTNPHTYTHLKNQRLCDVQEEIETLGRPLAPQSIQALDDLLNFHERLDDHDETVFAQEELKADAALYRDPRFLGGIDGHA